MKSLVVPLLLAAGLALVAPAGPAVADASTVPRPAEAPSWWTPPPEPTLVPVPATSCPQTSTTKRATCLGDALPLSDGEALAAAAADAAVRAGQASPLASSGSSSLTPADLTSLYRIPAVSTSATVGIVDVGSDPNTPAQLSYFRRMFGLPACTTANGCFREVAQDGSGALPPVDPSWTTEIAMDVQAVSAVCPTCHILLVDAASASSGDMGQAVLTATRLGASYLSLSYGSVASAGDRTLGSTYYADPNVTYVAATGDSGYAGGTLFPASAPNVIAAGGTTVWRSGSGWQQTAWSGSGSGCSPVAALPLSQSMPAGAATACDGHRAVSDLAALADPNTGMMFYRAGSWWSAGGTSLAAPIIASLYALAGNHTSPMSIYQNDASGFVDVASGSTGSCSPSVLCNAGPGWDGPTGLGSPSGLLGLAGSGAAAAIAYTDQTSATLTASGSYPIRLHYRLDDNTTGLPLGGAAVVVEGSTGGPFQVVDAGITGADGTLTVREHPKAATVYRVVFTGDSEHSSATSPSAATDAFVPKVKVRRRGTRLRAAVRAPWGAALRAWPLTLQHKAHGRWRTAKALRTNRSGSASTRVRHAGSYRIVYGGAGWRRGHTPAVRLR
ncbi:hypothetical protein [Nocardioides sp.]|uniref:hypothetical protein n=1 Tax=Nocardioides sp. TaxID=35761 RepID=UPI002B8B00E4|nr:hypothetical protein [Nocardioides sp.]HVX53248.1 hypothetical protein [Nocardioides sp.]